jgi:subtilisin family serine protease
VVKLIRRSCWLRAAFGLCIGALFSTISISDANAQRRAYQAPREFEELLVIRKPGAAPHALRADCAALGAEGVGDNPKLRMHRIRVPKHRLEAVKRHLERHADVEGVEENRRFEPESIPDDPLFSSQWHLPLIGADRAWDQQPAGAPIVIAILDTGIDLDHPDLAGQLVPGSNTFDGGSYEDYHGHGTRVAGVAGAVAFNAEGVASVAWNARIMPIRVTADSGSGGLERAHHADPGDRRLRLGLLVHPGQRPGLGGGQRRPRGQHELPERGRQQHHPGGRPVLRRAGWRRLRGRRQPGP